MYCKTSSLSREFFTGMNEYLNYYEKRRINGSNFEIIIILKLNYVKLKRRAMYSIVSPPLFGPM